jgi:hypothetical protein
MALRQVARQLIGQAQKASYPLGFFAPLGDACRGIASTSGSQLAEPQLAQAEEPAGLPRWERELGVVRTDWT